MGILAIHLSLANYKLLSMLRLMSYLLLLLFLVVNIQAAPSLKMAGEALSPGSTFCLELESGGERCVEVPGKGRVRRIADGWPVLLVKFLRRIVMAIASIAA